MRTIIVLCIAVLLLHLLNLIWLAVYCRLEAKVDNLKTKSTRPRGSDESAIIEKRQKGAIYLIKEIYKKLDKYFYGWMRYCIIGTGKIPSNRIRKILYKYVYCMKLSKGTVISGGCEIRSPWNITLGNCIVAGNCMLDGRAGIEIQDDAVLGMCVHIWTQEHDLNDVDFSVTPEHSQKVVIMPRAWCCSDSTILPGVTVGEGAVIASRACVTKDCCPFSVYGGVPAKKIADRNPKINYHLSGKPHWHFN